MVKCQMRDMKMSQKINCLRVIGIVCISLLWSMHINAEKPKWVGNPPIAGNSTYKFVEIVSSGLTISSARANALSNLAQDEQLGHAVEASVETGLLSKVNQTIKNGEMNESISDNMNIDVNLKGHKYSLQAVKVDEYVEGKKYGEVLLHTLFMVALSDNPHFDRAHVTNSYGAEPIFMSIIPGMGQWYKGCKVKGVSIFAAEAVTIAGIIVCENQRGSYIKKSKENPKFAKEYSDKADKWATGRNITIGVAAGLWLYNIIDAAVAKGARKVVLKTTNGSRLAMSPFATFEGTVGMSLAYKF